MCTVCKFSVYIEYLDDVLHAKYAKEHAATFFDSLNDQIKLRHFNETGSKIQYSSTTI